MYYPFMRGKRHELAALRKTVQRLNASKVIPIIEPLKENKNDLVRTIKALNGSNITPMVIINPLVGELVAHDSIDFYSDLVKKQLDFLPCVAFSQANFGAAYKLATQLSSDLLLFSTYFKDEPTFDVSSITASSKVNSVRESSNTTQRFIGSLPRLVKIKDSFNAQGRNADYPPLPSVYSDEHVTYSQVSNAIGFGDYQVVGEPYSESGGPARAVAIHITYIDPSQNNVMLIKHSVSTTDSGTTTNTGTKFLEALDELIQFANSTPALNQTTEGFQAFLDLHARRHYPNLGPVKEYSIMHHIESISSFL
ncbi:sce7725 family protein [Agarivorans sp. QJM3NY_29]|uniref:sce7725 family protein n=1 Tax=unclassified Agarivorans TaxID=2636026 RepID=UPI003D7EA28D